MPAPRPRSRRMCAAFSFDDVVPSYGVSSRKIVKTLQAAVDRLGIPHPLHVHCNNLGVPGAADTAAATIAAAEGVPLHLAHLQFYGYGTEGKRKFSSAAARLAELVNGSPEVTIDVGQVMFGQTVTISLDVMRQFRRKGSAHPKKSVIHDGDGNGGGIVPYRYRKDFYGTLQWAVGLELFLLIDRSLARVLHHRPSERRALHRLSQAVRTADEPRCAQRNGVGAFASRRWRCRRSAAIDREYTFEEIAIMTRAAPAKLLGLTDRGHLGAGAIADIAVYRRDKDIAKMLGAAALRVQEWRPRREGRRDHPLSLGQGVAAQSADRTARWCGGWRTITSAATACRSTGSPSPIPPSSAKRHSVRCHAAA